MSENGNSVPAVERALTMLELLAKSKSGISISEMSRKLSLPKSSIHLIMTTLERRGYLQKNPQSRKYQFGLKMFSLSRIAVENLEIRDEARPYLISLMKKTGLTVHMGVLEWGEVVIIEKIDTPSMIKVATWVGRRMDVNCTGVGKALLAFMTEEDLDNFIKMTKFTKHNQKSISSMNKLKKELERIREQGYSFDDEEDEIGLRCIGAPIYDSSQKVIAAISVAGTTSQIESSRVQVIAKVVMETGRTISAQLGYWEI